jgi:hypothetical protein
MDVCLSIVSFTVVGQGLRYIKFTKNHTVNKSSTHQCSLLQNSLLKLLHLYAAHHGSWWMTLWHYIELVSVNTKK